MFEVYFSFRYSSEIVNLDGTLQSDNFSVHSIESVVSNMIFVLAHLNESGLLIMAQIC